MINFEALFKVTYGLYIVSSGDRNRGNGFISNSVFQVTAEPAQFAVCCSKNNFTSELIKKHGAFSVSVLELDTPTEIFGTFGYKSGRDIDKLAGMNITYGETGVPIIMNSSIACLEFKVTDTIDVGTHLMFISELLHSRLIDESKEPITYLFYRNVRKASAPKNAPTYIEKSKLENKSRDVSLKKYECPICGYVYDESVEKVKFRDLPDDWGCPACGTEKTDFIEIINN